MLVCVCHGISDRDIDSVLQDGASSFQDVRSSLGFGSNCGKCASFAKDMVSQKMAQAQSANAYQLAYEVRV